MQPTNTPPQTENRPLEKIKPIMTRTELCTYLGISIVSLDREIKKGLPYFTVGSRNKRFRLTEVDAWYNVQRQMRR